MRLRSLLRVPTVTVRAPLRKRKKQKHGSQADDKLSTPMTSVVIPAGIHTRTEKASPSAQRLSGTRPTDDLAKSSAVVTLTGAGVIGEALAKAAAQALREAESAEVAALAAAHRASEARQKAATLKAAFDSTDSPPRVLPQRADSFTALSVASEASGGSTRSSPRGPTPMRRAKSFRDATEAVASPRGDRVSPRADQAAQDSTRGAALEWLSHAEAAAEGRSARTPSRASPSSGPSAGPSASPSVGPSSAEGQLQRSVSCDDHITSGRRSMSYSDGAVTQAGRSSCGGVALEGVAPTQTAPCHRRLFPESPPQSKALSEPNLNSDPDPEAKAEAQCKAMPEAEPEVPEVTPEAEPEVEPEAEAHAERKLDTNEAEAEEILDAIFSPEARVEIEAVLLSTPDTTKIRTALEVSAEKWSSPRSVDVRLSHVDSPPAPLHSRGSESATAPPRKSLLSPRAAASLQARMASLTSCTPTSPAADTVGSFSADLVARLEADTKAASERVTTPSPPLKPSRPPNMTPPPRPPPSATGDADGGAAYGWSRRERGPQGQQPPPERGEAGATLAPRPSSPRPSSWMGGYSVATSPAAAALLESSQAAAVVRLQSAARGMVVRKVYEKSVNERVRKEWIAYYVYYGQLDEARELGWTEGESAVAPVAKTEECVIS